MGAAVGDDAVDDAVELVRGEDGANVGRRRKPGRSKDEASKVGVEYGDGFERATDFLRVTCDIGVEESFRDNLQRETHHFGVNVSRLAVTPFGEQAFGEARHRFTVGDDTRAVEGGLSQTTLPEPEITFADQQPVAEETLVGFEDAALGKFAGLRNQKLLD